MVAEGLWGESKGQRERHDQSRPGETPLDRASTTLAAAAATGEQAERACLDTPATARATGAVLEAP